MDPDQALQEARDAIQTYRAEGLDPNDPALSLLLADAIINAFEALDGWLSRGGFLPAAWRDACPPDKLTES